MGGMEKGIQAETLGSDATQERRLVDVEVLPSNFWITA
jgi:hypothetical protein